MSDKFRKERLPDLPNAGYATQRQKELTDALMLILRHWEREERALILMIAIEGLEAFFPLARKKWGPHGISDDKIREVYAYLVAIAGPDPMGQLANLITIVPNRRSWTEAEKEHIGRYGRLPEVSS